MEIEVNRKLKRMENWIEMKLKLSEKSVKQKNENGQNEN